MNVDSWWIIYVEDSHMKFITKVKDNERIKNIELSNLFLAYLSVSD